MTPKKTSSSGWQSMITGSQTSMLLDWCQGRSTDVSSTSNCAVQPIQWSFVDEQWPWITYDFHVSMAFRAVLVLLSLLRPWCIWRHLEAGWRLVAIRIPADPPKKPSRQTPSDTPRLGSARLDCVASPPRNLPSRSGLPMAGVGS